MSRNTPITFIQYPLEHKLKELEEKYYKIILSKFDFKLSRARDKKSILDELIDKHLMQYYACIYSNEYRRKILTDFYYYYQRGIPIDTLMPRIYEDHTLLKTSINEIGDVFFEKITDHKLIRFFAKFAA